MKPYFKFGVMLCVMALSISAFAGSITTVSYSAVLNGVPNTTVYGSFSYNTATDTFTSASLSFVGNSIFGGLSGTVNQPQYGSSFVLNETIAGYTVSYDILLNMLNPASYTAFGYISSGQGAGGFRTQVPDGGSPISYLSAAGLVLFAGIILAGKQRRLRHI